MTYGALPSIGSESLVLPERTIDSWISSCIHSVDPDALVWAPSANAQEDGDPWDFAAQLDRYQEKVFLLENKALRAPLGWTRTFVPLDMRRLRKLYGIWLLTGLPIFYGLPDLSPADISTWAGMGLTHRAHLRRVPRRFEDWLRIVHVNDLVLWPSVSARLTQGSAELNTSSMPPGAGIRRFLIEVLCCRQGLNGSEMANAIASASLNLRGLNGAVIDDLVRDARSEEVPTDGLRGWLSERLADQRRGDGLGVLAELGRLNLVALA